MSAHSGPKIATTDLSFAIDPANKQSSMRNKQSSNILVDPHTWTTGTGGFTGYGSNGSASEQLRVVVNDDPWGNSSIVWRTTPDSTSGADGGWNTSSYAIDRNFTYRYSVWVRRHTAGTGGTFYLGMNPSPIRNDNNAVQSNPYFSTPSQSSLTLNQWYLVVAHCFYEGYSGGRHVDSGWYENGTKITDKSYGNVGSQDVRWNSSTTAALHRTYHYYTTNTASGLEFAFPRIDKCDGSEPSVQKLMQFGESTINSIAKPNINTAITATMGFNYSNGGSYVFDGTPNWVDITGISITGDRAVSFWCNPAEVTTDWRSVIDAESGRYIIGTISNKFQLYSVNAWRGGPDATLNQWQYIVFSTTGNVTSWYKNGKFVGSYTGTIPAIGGNVIIGARYAKETAYLNAKLSRFSIHDKALTAKEIRRNFISMKRRFGL